MIDLNTQGWIIQIAPEYGGVITACQYEGLDILRPATPQWFAGYDPAESAYFPLVPFSNRIDGGRFQFDGKEIILRKNAAPEPHALHGMGWQSAWDVTDHTDTQIVLSHEHSKGNWPWSYEARQSFTIRGQSLTLSLSLTNTSDSVMPAGLGFHPYFPISESTALAFKAKTVWMPNQDTKLYPQTQRAVPASWDFSQGKKPGADIIDHCFSGWDGKARISPNLSLAADSTLNHAVLYMPEGEDYFSFEPVTHINNAVNTPCPPEQTGVRPLYPGETMTVSMRIDVD